MHLLFRRIGLDRFRVLREAQMESVRSRVLLYEALRSRTEMCCVFKLLFVLILRRFEL